MIASNDKQRLFSICVVVSDDLPLSDEVSPPSDEDQLQDKARPLQEVYLRMILLKRLNACTSASNCSCTNKRLSNVIMD